MPVAATASTDPMKPTLTKAEFTASQRSKMFHAKQTQRERICQERKGKKDTITSGVLRRQQKAAAAYFKRPAAA